MARPSTRSARPRSHQAIELLARQFQERETRPAEEQKTVDRILHAAEHGEVDELRRLLDARPDLIDARGANFQRTALHLAAWLNRLECVKLLLERGANVRIRDFGDNAYARISPPNSPTRRSSGCWSRRAPM